MLCGAAEATVVDVFNLLLFAKPYCSWCRRVFALNCGQICLWIWLWRFCFIFFTFIYFTSDKLKKKKKQAQWSDVSGTVRTPVLLSHIGLRFEMCRKMTAGILVTSPLPPTCPPCHCDNNQQIGKVNSRGRVGKWVWAGCRINISFSHKAEVSYILSLSIAVTLFDPP